MDTLNLVGWLSGTLSLFRQLQQLPMVSEQPVRPRGKRKGEGHQGQLQKALLWGRWQNHIIVITHCWTQ